MITYMPLVVSYGIKVALIGTGVFLGYNNSDTIGKFKRTIENRALSTIERDNRQVLEKIVYETDD